MDPTRFDALARALAAPRSRRRLLAGLAVGALGLAGPRPAGAAPAACPAGTVRCLDGCKACPPGQVAGPVLCRCHVPPTTTTTGTTSATTSTSTTPACLPNTSPCTSGTQCCSLNCFNGVCAALVTSCSGPDCGSSCNPPANGCAGCNCCYGTASC